MSQSSERITLHRCPMCQGRHVYELAVDRSVIIKMLTAMDAYERPTSRRFKRFFTCPIKNEDFEATIVLTETSSDRIQDVTVIGPSAEGS